MAHPSGSTLNAAELLARFDEQARAQIPDEPGIHVRRTAVTVRISGLWECVVFSRLTEETANAAIAVEKKRPSRVGCKLEWKVYGHDRPGDLAERLQRAGFAREETETLVALDLGADHAVLAALVPPDGVEIRRVAGGDALDDVVIVGSRAFGRDYSWMNDEFRARIEHGTAHFYVAYDASGEPVGAGRLETPRSGEFAGLYGGGIVPERRGRGIYKALVSARARDARERGYRFLTVDAADTSLPILCRWGFAALTTVTAFTWRP